MGKSGTAEAPPSAPQQDNSMAMIMPMMMQMMESMGTQNMPPVPPPIPAPEIEQAAPVDWASQMEDLGNKAKYDAEAKDRKGRLSTLHTSLTDDDEETEMSTSLLGK